jgi:beta-N-acetylhexosaminidase
MTAIGSTTSLAERKARAGQMLVIGFSGPDVDDALREVARTIQPAGFILFARNVVEPGQVLELNSALRALLPRGLAPLRTIDQEGGRVQRVRAPATEWPSMREVGATAWVAEVARGLAAEVRAMGFDLTFAPVADVDSNPANPVIGARSFGRDPDAVAACVATFTQSLQAAGVLGCAKHFPGHGDTHLDSHLALPTVDIALPELLHRELVPFEAAVRADVATVMSAHVVFPALDPDHPATLSPVVIPELLRRRLGYGGVVFSDDLEMKAVAGRWSAEDLVRKGIEATIDVFLACKEHHLQLEVFEALVRAQEQDEAVARAVADSARRVHALRARLPTGAGAEGLRTLGCDAHATLADRVRREAAAQGIA